jgi:hypothetical protein
VFKDQLPFVGEDNSRFFKSWQQEVFLALSLPLSQEATGICLLLSGIRWLLLNV